MMFEYTVLTTLAFYHLVIGGLLVAMLLLLNKVWRSSSETLSWLWMTVFILSTVVPFTLISLDTSGIEVKPNNITEIENIETAAQAIPIIAISEVQDSWNWHLPSELIFNFSGLLTAMFVLWGIGSIWRTINALKTVVRTRKLTEPSLTPLQPLSTDLKVDVCSSAQISSPMVVGLLKPKVILPQAILPQLTTDQVTAIVLHEQAHIQRKDNWFGLFQEFIAILFWWSPIIRFISQRIHFEREIACDLRAATLLKDNKTYAQSLVDCAKLMVNEQQNVLAMSLFSKKKELNYRIGAVLQNNLTRSPNKFAIALACVIVGVTTVNAAQLYSPKISIKNTIGDARVFSVLERHKGERLLEAVKRNDLDSIELLLNEGVDINTPVVRDGTALMIAVKTRNEQMVRSLIALGADVNQASLYDGNPLIIAAKTNNIRMAQLLLNEGAQINAVVPRDETPLINAARFGDVELVRFLVENGADVNQTVTTGIEDGYENRSPLNMASSQEIRDYLLINGAIN